MKNSLHSFQVSLLLLLFVSLTQTCQIQTTGIPEQKYSVSPGVYYSYSLLSESQFYDSSSFILVWLEIPKNKDQMILQKELKFFSYKERFLKRVKGILSEPRFRVQFSKMSGKELIPRAGMDESMLVEFDSQTNWNVSWNSPDLPKFMQDQKESVSFAPFHFGYQKKDYGLWLSYEDEPLQEGSYAIWEHAERSTLVNHPQTQYRSPTVQSEASTNYNYDNNRFAHWKEDCVPAIIVSAGESRFAISLTESQTARGEFCDLLSKKPFTQTGSLDYYPIIPLRKK